MDKDTAWLLHDTYGGVETPEFQNDKERLAKGEPLAYVIGWVPFLHTKIWLDSRPLIPRPETEYWVEKSISDIKQLFEVEPRTQIRILDLCAGSGCIGIAILKAIQNAHVDFAEIDAKHHETIRKNIFENKIDPMRTKIFGGDVFENITEKYDCILTNPPYIDPLLSERIGKSVLEHEPKLALFGGRGGMEIITRIIHEAPSYLKPGGILYIEHEPEHVEHIKALIPNAEIFKDQFGVERFSKITF